MKRINRWQLRRVAILVFGALLVLGIAMLLGVQVSEEHSGTIELINGQANTDALALPLMLSIVGAAGLMAALGWKPNRR